MKRLAIFCDGTWNSADQATDGVPSPSNVVKLALRVAKRDGEVPQVVYYDQGVGTGNSLDKFTGGAFGKGLDDNLHAAYRFLMLNYEMGDQIYLFGFSRGAYTVRSLAGMVRKCGILHRRATDRYHEAIEIYSDPHHPNDAGPTNFRRDHSLAEDANIPIRMIGVWDTVGALGVPVRGLRWLTADEYRFHDVELSGSVERAYQALAIDERRAPFEAARWTYKPKNEQVVEQVWFCGVHSDIGGGYPRDRQPGLLSDFTLAWLRDKAADAGLAIDHEADVAFPPRADHRATLHNSKTGLYRLTPGIDRVIGLAAEAKTQPDEKSTRTDPSQSLHESVFKRWDADPEYRPKNLRAYFARVNDSRAEQP